MVQKLSYDHMHSRVRIELSALQDQHLQALEIQQVWIHGAPLLLYNGGDDRMVNLYLFPMTLHALS